jgi:hypothetical protein
MAEAMGAGVDRAFFLSAGRICAKLVIFTIVGASLAACGVSQLTEPLQRGLFGGDKPQEAETQAAPVTPSNLAGEQQGDTTGGFRTSLASTSLGCPKLEIANDGRTVTFSAPGGDNDPRAVMHRGEIDKVARECGTSVGGIAIKYGFSGRVLLGPRGKPGSITLPAKLTVVDRTNVVLQTQNIRVVVNVPAGQTAGAFSEVKEIDLPIPAGVSAKNYKIIIGFDNPPGTTG